MKYNNISSGESSAETTFHGSGSLVFSVLVPLILLRCDTPEEIREILIDGEGDSIDYASLSILKTGANLSQYVDDEADGFSDSFLDVGSVVVLSYPGDDYRWEVVTKNEYLKILRDVLTGLVSNRVIYDQNDVAGVLRIISDLRDGKV